MKFEKLFGKPDINSLYGRFAPYTAKTKFIKAASLDADNSGNVSKKKDNFAYLNLLFV